MIRQVVLFLALLMIAPSWSAAQQSCSDFSVQGSPLFWDPFGDQGHLTGAHQFYSTLTASCSYTGMGNQYCTTACSAYGSISHQDTGALSNPFYQHNLGNSVNGGFWEAVNASGSISCQTTAAATVTSCLLSCATSISFSGSQSGVGVSVSFPADAIFGLSQGYGFSCFPELDPQWCGGKSPIIIDTTGEGFQLTSAADGVRFDIRGNGRPQQLSWTARGSHNAFLALDRGHGITSGKDLFGNFTPQPKSADPPNGYLALAVFDTPQKGGNGNGVIDPGDAVYPKLLLWIDENHDGIAQPNELHHLAELGVFSLSLSYADSPYTDAFGNQFRYKGKVNPLGEPTKDHVDRTSYDVFLAGLPNQNGGTDSVVQCGGGGNGGGTD